VSVLCLPFILALSALLPAAVFAQTSRSGVRPRVSPVESLPQPAVPSDPLELVTGDAQPVQTAEQRLAATNLVENARALSNVRAHAYDLKTTFTSSGGDWNLEDISPSHNAYRWSAQGLSYAAVNLHLNKLFYTNQPAGPVPLRLAQVRSAIFFAYRLTGPRATLRTFAGNLNGAEVSCVLVSHGPQTMAVAGGRRWEESESCIDPKTGLLMTYSPVPGMFVRYDYTNAIRFHDKTVAGKFTITEAGQAIVEARTESVTDPANLDPALFEPAGLTQVGVGPVSGMPWYARSSVIGGAPNANSTIHAVVLHGLLSPDGALSETEVVASSNASLNQSALDKAAEWKNWQADNNEVKPGATPQWHEVFFVVKLLAPAQ